ncbi:MAG: hypothetical protein V7631_651, partial [Massilia sp.]
MKAPWLARAMAVAALTLAAGGVWAVPAWNLPQDNATFTKAEIAQVLAGNDFPETTQYRQKIDYIDFDSYGR